MDAEFKEISDLSCETGFCAIRDEAEWHFVDDRESLKVFVEKLAILEDHYERAMVTFLEHPGFWKGALLFNHADTLSYWRKRKGLPHVPASVHADGREELAKSIRGYFHEVEGRGKNCVVEAYRRGELDYFFAYPEDFSQKSVEWVDGEFARRPHNPAFEVVYVYSEKDGTLDLNYRGARNAVEPLQGMFATAILRLPKLPPDLEDSRIYDLDPLSTRGFQFIYDPTSGIQTVAVKKIRFSSNIIRGDRITFEADCSVRSESIYDLVEQASKSMSLRPYHVTQVEIAAKVVVHGEGRPKSITIRITYPNSCSLKYDEIDLKLRTMLVDSGIEPRESTQVLTLEGPEPVDA